MKFKVQYFKLKINKQSQHVDYYPFITLFNRLAKIRNNRLFDRLEFLFFLESALIDIYTFVFRKYRFLSVDHRTTFQLMSLELNKLKRRN